jgi:chloramphenicol 3-O phosphotransferase
VVQIETGDIGARTMLGMRHAIAAMAHQGNHMIIDEVILGNAKTQYQDLLSAFDFHVVGIFASLEVLERKARGDRMSPVNQVD